MDPAQLFEIPTLFEVYPIEPIRTGTIHIVLTDRVVFIQLMVDVKSLVSCTMPPPWNICHSIFVTNTMATLGKQLLLYAQMPDDVVVVPSSRIYPADYPSIVMMRCIMTPARKSCHSMYWGIETIRSKLAKAYNGFIPYVRINDKRSWLDLESVPVSLLISRREELVEPAHARKR